MFKLLIADDEQLEREALRYIISKSIDSIIDIEDAVNGREAISKAQASKPDIIILDINMPGINGIEAAWKIREKDKNVSIIFLTAFHQFDYAHEAIKIGVDDYIIKPSSEKRIIEVMEKVIFKLKNEKNARRERENIEIKLDKATDYLCSEFTYNLATRNINNEKFRNYLTLLDMDFSIGRGAILKLDYDSYPIKVDSDYQKHILKKRSIRLLNNILKQNNIDSTFNMDLNNIYILIYSAKKECIIQDEAIFSSICQSIISKVKEDINIRILLGFGTIFCCSETAVQSFTEAKKSLTGSDKNLILKAEELPLEIEMNLEQTIIAADRDKTEEIFLELEQWIQLSTAPFASKRSNLKGLVAILRHAASTQFPQDDCSINICDIKEANSINELITAMKVFLNEILDMIIKMYDQENIPAIKKACCFIKNNYSRDISLEETATFCNLSTFYFSKIFKKDKKKNFITFLTEIRISEAKKLLSGTNQSMKEITSNIGYKDPNYFTRVFKKMENLSPSDYRSKKMLKKQKSEESTLKQQIY